MLPFTDHLFYLKINALDALYILSKSLNNSKGKYHYLNSQTDNAYERPHSSSRVCEPDSYLPIDLCSFPILFFLYNATFPIY